MIHVEIHTSPGLTMLNGAPKTSEGYTRRDTIAGEIPQKPNRKQHWEKP